ncbi:hypothetical protein CHARACLAT_025020 [Characodon lateralis]|uniref:Uncharacterized protein n=1 Tax=Characodon lateralis TaxID=208331 RepID=A0ABU7EWU5_9TELE|nr:hypothetical protein [Characodon lateralis]
MKCYLVGHEWRLRPRPLTLLLVGGDQIHGVANVVLQQPEEGSPQVPAELQGAPAEDEGGVGDIPTLHLLRGFGPVGSLLGSHTLSLSGGFQDEGPIRSPPEGQPPMFPGPGKTSGCDPQNFINTSK